MPSEHKEKQAVTVWVDKSMVKRIEKLAEKAGLNRSKLVENVLDVGVSQLETMASLGVISTVVFFRDLKDRVKNWSDDEQNNIIGSRRA